MVLTVALPVSQQQAISSFPKAIAAVLKLRPHSPIVLGLQLERQAVCWLPDSERDKLTDALNSESFWVPSLFYDSESTAFSTVWIPVQITNRGDVNTAKTFTSFCQLKSHISFRESSWPHLSQVKWTLDKSS